MNNKMETIILGGGCFWCLEAVFLRVNGVDEVTSGYAGGHNNSPTYEDVSSGKSGHAEVVKIDFDSEVIKLEDILHIFFTIHDPTTVNRQGNDIGSQYRSIALYLDENQKVVIESVKNELTEKNVFENPIITENFPLEKFYPAEQYHQKYFEKNPDSAYCQIVVTPKIAKFREKYKIFYK